jgi:hypothetical protein
MADQQDFEKLLPKLNAIAQKDVRPPDMPIDEAVKEGEIMAAAAAQDANALAAVGLGADVIDEIGCAVSALRYAEAKLISELGEIKEAAKQWATEEPAGFELRNDLLAASAYALRDIGDAMRSVKRIRQGTSGNDMVQDLLALSELGKKYLNQLKTINFDPALLDNAAQKASFLGKLYAKAFIEKGSKEAKVMRDRAFTYMRNVMSAILGQPNTPFAKTKRGLIITTALTGAVVMLRRTARNLLKRSALLR